MVSMESKYSVLLVDDDKFLLEMYRKKFEGRVGHVDLAIGSKEALEHLRECPAPDIIILDIIMPEMDGIELLEKIREEKLAPSATIIMLTNENNRVKIEKAKELGVKGYIVKATSIPSEVVEEALKIVNLAHQ